MVAKALALGVHYLLATKKEKKKTRKVCEFGFCPSHHFNGRLMSVLFVVFWAFGELMATSDTPAVACAMLHLSQVLHMDLSFMCFAPMFSLLPYLQISGESELSPFLFWETQPAGVICM